MRWLPALLALAVLAAPSVSAQTAPTGTGVTIAVLDTGVDSSHSELSGRVTRVSFWESGLPGGVPIDLPLAQDPDGQGTAVASVAAGRTLGLAPQARILDLQVSAQYTNGVADPATEAAAINAMDYLLQSPSRAQVVIMSFAAAGVSDAGAATLAEQADGLWREGVLVVVPTGPQTNALTESPWVMTVTGTEQCPTVIASPNLKPDVAAKSQGVQAAQPGSPGQPGGTGAESGTAMAAAHAAGALALLRSGFPEMPADAMAWFLRDTAVDEDDEGPDDCSGFGAVDADAAVMWAAEWHDPLAQAGKRAVPLPAVLLLAPLGAAAWRRRK